MSYADSAQKRTADLNDLHGYAVTYGRDRRPRRSADLHFLYGDKEENVSRFRFYALTGGPKEDSVAVLFGFSATKGGSHFVPIPPLESPLFQSECDDIEDLCRSFERAAAHT